MPHGKIDFGEDDIEEEVVNIQDQEVESTKEDSQIDHHALMEN